jgi:CubicO group peptidase (beta-lactamase class C family)
MSDPKGACPDHFGPVRRAFTEAIADGTELGCGFALVVEGELVVDLSGGMADRAGTRPFDARTLTPVFSTTKALAAILVARLVDQGRLAYDQPVAEVWPEFGQAGKAEVTVAQALSHQAGVPGFAEAMDPELWFDWDAICAKIAAAEPMWAPGTASGYHAATYGFIAGEIFRRIDGRTMGQALAQDLRRAHGLDLWIGVPETEDVRVAEVERPRSLPDFGEINEARRVAFMTRWASPAASAGAGWRRAELPASNGHADAASLARLMGALATDGALDGRPLLSRQVIAEASRERIAGPDLVMPYTMSWGAGFMRNTASMYGPNPDSFGHSGWGGSCAFADPRRGVAMAYVMNRQSSRLLGDPRPRKLIEAAYGCL